MLVMRDVTTRKNLELKDKTNLREKYDIVKIQDWQDDKILMQYARNPEILRMVSNFIGDDIHSIHTMYINKPPDAGSGSSRHPPHQDLWYFPFRPADRIVASWSALEIINEKNGCLYVIPGSHKSNLRLHLLRGNSVLVNYFCVNLESRISIRSFH
jgi:phytanoyl-CoA hydroxylase